MLCFKHNYLPKVSHDRLGRCLQLTVFRSGQSSAVIVKKTPLKFMNRHGPRWCGTLREEARPLNRRLLVL